MEPEEEKRKISSNPRTKIPRRGGGKTYVIVTKSQRERREDRRGTKGTQRAFIYVS